MRPLLSLRQGVSHKVLLVYCDNRGECVADLLEIVTGRRHDSIVFLLEHKNSLLDNEMKYNSTRKINSSEVAF